MVFPGLIMRVRTSNSPPWMMPWMSRLILAMRMSARGWKFSIACTRMPVAGAMCCSCSFQAPWAWTVERYVFSPVGR